MGRAVSGVALLAVGASLLACDGSAGRSRAVVDAAPPDRPGEVASTTPPPAPSDGGGFDFNFPPFEVAPPPEFPPPPAALPLPPGMTPHRLLGPDDRLAGNGVSACTWPDPSKKSARWCVFYRLGPATPPATPSTELWVINASKAMAGDVPKCDGSSADCLRLTDALWTGLPLGGPGHPFSHEFRGETLIYYAGSKSMGQQLHQGNVYAWRPGWSSPKIVTSDKGIMCTGHARKPLVFCLDDLAGDPMHPDSFGVRLGSIEPPPTAPLPTLGRLRPYDSTGTVAWGAALSPDGEQFLFSSPEPDPAVEVLRVVPTSAPTTAPREIIRDASIWVIGNDGKRIYFMRRAPAVDGGADDERPRSLHAADFPSGLNEVKLGNSVRDFILLGEGSNDEGVAFLSSPTGDRTSFRYVRDTRKPEAVVTVFTYRDLLEGVRMSPDLRYTAWLDQGFRARVVRHGDLNVCKLNVYTQGAAFDPQFLEHAELVFWNEDLPSGDRRDGFYGRPDDCGGTRRFAISVNYYTPLGDRALIYSDERDDSQRAVLKIAPITKQADGALGLGTPLRIHDHIEEGSYTLIGSPPDMVLFRAVGKDEPEPGTWVFGPLPFAP